MKRKAFVFLILLFVFAGWQGAFGEDLFIGENLVYDFGWSGFTAARAEISIKDIQFQGVDCYNLQLKIRSLARLEWMWKVRDKLTSYCRKTDLQPEFYKYVQREGKFSLDTVVEHDRELKILRSERTRYKKGKTKKYNPKWVKAAGRLDPLAGMLHLRRQDLKIGDKYKILVFDGKREHDVVYKVVRKETIDTKFGKKETFVVRPKIAKSSGDKPKGVSVEKVEKVTLWVGTTPKHLVYRIESKVFIGSVFAELVEK